MIRIMFVCHGNICRSTMAESIFTHMVKIKNIEKDFFISSSGTSREEIGNSVHYETVKKLKENGIPIVKHFAIQLKSEDLKDYDYFIGMDFKNIINMKKILGNDEKIFLLKEFIFEKSDIADPWYTGNFDITYKEIYKSLEGFLKYLGY